MVSHYMDLSDIERELFQETPTSGHYIALGVYGETGAGKTTLPTTTVRPDYTGPVKVVIVDCEEGSLSIKGAPGTRVWKATSWRELERIYYFLRNGRHEIETVGFDTASSAERLAIAHVLGLGEAPDLEQLTTASGSSPVDKREYGLAGRLMEEFFYKVVHLKDRMNVVVTAHRKRITDDVRGDEFAPQFMPSVEPIFRKWLDAIGYLEAETEIVSVTGPDGNVMLEERFKNTLTIGPKPGYVTKNRLSGLYVPKERQVPGVLVNPTMRGILAQYRGHLARARAKRAQATTVEPPVEATS